jgi:hypothetical protein
MTDKELLELAAKAAGYILDHGISAMYPYADVLYLDGEVWNPLTDDGDVLRLAVAIAGNGWAFAELDTDAGNGEPVWMDKNDPCAATRRAITSSAAEIGKEMK